MPNGVGTIMAEPTTDVGTNQWVNLTFSGFGDIEGQGTRLDINYCANVAPLSATVHPICVNQGNAQLTGLPYTISTFAAGPAQGTASVSFPVAEVEDPNPPLVGAVPDDPNDSGTFFCDGTAANPCSIDITEPAIELGNFVPDNTNTAVIPIQFAPATSGCSSPTLVTTESEFGIERLLPAVDRLACADPNQSSTPIAVNTATDGLTAVTDLAKGSTDLAFTDDPESPDQQAQLKAGQDVLIPIALSANVIGFKATVGGSPTFPQGKMDLTPTEVAGLVTNFYSGWTSSDLVTCTPGSSTWCVNSLPCTSLGCSILAELNAVSTSADSFLTPAGQYSGFVRSDAAGTTDQLTAWLCGAGKNPLEPIEVNGQPVTEPASSSTVFVEGLNNRLPQTSQLTSCPVTDTFPPLQNQSTFFSEVTDPSQQLVKMLTPVAPPGSGNPGAGFAPMNWAEALYFGLSVANLQDPAGAFVAPSADSIDAALADATVNPDGSLTPSTTDTSDTAAYPMPTVIYAAVPTAPVSADEAAQITGVLNEILALTAGSDSAQLAGSGQLPPGFVPLTPTLAAQATQDISKDITVAPTPPPPPPTSTSDTTPSSSDQSVDDSGDQFSLGFDNSDGFDQSSFGNLGFDNGLMGLNYQSYQSFGPTTTPLGQAGSTGRSTARNHTSRNPFVALGPIPHSFLLEASSDRLLLPATLGLGLLALAWGLLLLSARVRRGLLLAAAFAGRQLRRVAPEERPPVEPPS
jgi:hypothetical protein